VMAATTENGFGLGAAHNNKVQVRYPSRTVRVTAGNRNVRGSSECVQVPEVRQ
jgi:hypothetical protein